MLYASVPKTGGGEKKHAELKACAWRTGDGGGAEITYGSTPTQCRPNPKAKMLVDCLYAGRLLERYVQPTAYESSLDMSPRTIVITALWAG